MDGGRSTLGAVVGARADAWNRGADEVASRRRRRAEPRSRDLTASSQTHATFWLPGTVEARSMYAQSQEQPSARRRGWSAASEEDMLSKVGTSHGESCEDHEARRRAPPANGCVCHDVGVPARELPRGGACGRHR